MANLLELLGDIAPRERHHYITPARVLIQEMLGNLSVIPWSSTKTSRKEPREDTERIEVKEAVDETF
eukprot:CAMPEP_0204001802 /NCGR_PEP_ID=MMETSP0360-20130528/16459_1 /ASSEMBLY_ACC=CAM_ASM_000342 /TAXON_ID=268821 /ORGANISM="Scrippsiella Hangoei, Strain SHTV-5" /LENGTH=66 /DNA_ID=CAMNT_0050943345 /DNA_START=109 /DNA_END=307 /DNA_ORIENTATION=-